jgi:hypothetical protein
MNSCAKAMNLAIVVNSHCGVVAVFVPALLAGRIVFAPVWMALFDEFDGISNDLPGFLGSMRPKKRFGNLMLTQTTDHLSWWHIF